jgi:sarcosine oxidase subunit beta
VKSTYDAIVIGAGSVGVPCALYLTLEGLNVLVIDSNPSPGQGQNKAAIGGVRATHSDPAKILICRESLQIFSEWQETYGHDIGWKKGGYCFPVFTSREEDILKGILPIQKSYGLNIDWLDADGIKEVVPGIASRSLIGGTFSPDDGQVSPLLAIHAMFRVSRDKGCTYCFQEQVCEVLTENGSVKGVRTQKDSYYAPVIVNAAGAEAAQVGNLSGIEIPVAPDSHEAGISSPMEQFLGPLVVDLRPGPEGKTANFYFAQNLKGAVIFCYTPSTIFPGTDREPTSEFLPIVARRMISLVPRLKNMLVRHVWRGLYPMTPDSLPICGPVKEIKGMYLAVGMCGQGFMMGPGVGKNIAHCILHDEPLIQPDIFDALSFYRDFHKSKEKLK